MSTRLLLILALCFFARTSFAADTLYSRAFGNATDPAVIFLHGGPGYNSASFEIASAQRLADSGFHVVTFDQRGCGRSGKLKGTYTLEEAMSDLNTLFEKYGFAKASLIGHSWGGTLGILFAERYPVRVSKLVLTGSPLSYQLGFRTIATRARAEYTRTNDSLNLTFLDGMLHLDTNSLMYATSAFRHAMAAGMYRPSVTTDEAKALKEKIKADTLSKWLNDMKQAPVLGFYKSMQYTTLDLTAPLTRVNERIKVFGIYGADDGLFDEAHLAAIRKIIGEYALVSITGASHNVFLDQPTAFTSALVDRLRAN
jgi:proline iminopeptidase